jgi:Domain of unknown function (DUF4272)
VAVGSTGRPTAAEISDRILVLYALTRRGAIELIIDETHGDPQRIAQAEAARVETDRWLQRESLTDAPTPGERRLFAATSGSWPREAVHDAMWRRESMGVLLWALQHLEELPDFSSEFDQAELDGAVMRYGSVSSFRANGGLRPDDQIERAWMEADAWYGATEGRIEEDAALASTAAERFRALSWLRDASAAPA